MPLRYTDDDVQTLETHIVLCKDCLLGLACETQRQILRPLVQQLADEIDSELFNRVFVDRGARARKATATRAGRQS